MGADQLSLQCARAHDRVGVRRFHRGQELVRLFNRSGEVGVGEENELALRFHDSMPNRIPLAAVSRIAQYANPGPLRSDLHRVVRRSVIYDDDFDEEVLSLDVLVNRCQRVGNTASLIVCRYHDAKEWLRHVAKLYQKLGIGKGQCGDKARIFFGWEEPGPFRIWIQRWH